MHIARGIQQTRERIFLVIRLFVYDKAIFLHVFSASLDTPSQQNGSAPLKCQRDLQRPLSISYACTRNRAAYRDIDEHVRLQHHASMQKETFKPLLQQNS